MIKNIFDIKSNIIKLFVQFTIRSSKLDRWLNMMRFPCSLTFAYTAQEYPSEVSFVCSTHVE